MITMILKKAIQRRKDVYLCLIGYAKVFGDIVHKELLGKLYLFDKCISVELILGGNRTESNLSTYTKREKLAREVSAFTDLFKLYSEAILKVFKTLPRLIIRI